jgi:hypothetical protein
MITEHQKNRLDMRELRVEEAAAAIRTELAVDAQAQVTDDYGVEDDAVSFTFRDVEYHVQVGAGYYALAHEDGDAFVFRDATGIDELTGLLRDLRS